ncbi:hypothetical protein H257_11165 [Aphanomyces astaci]|uniref:Uncharacterized protein n=1 Tax=Aphanomyces astaci TaxID=112090 RepID=W4G3D1_APHAT|nr:hypothetical protein H257_11165 [Aphanomyces astaci]ETV74212.1 hypothetical protein H257_11165 [Aphanomyces astaci]RQM25652.1 hypothetical protein B5M09_005390 [Aphanomyces astaci]|eukprot:XP_009836318.1 hypothetical protein H257_11165 [Aphanomyces astaci]
MQQSSELSLVPSMRRRGSRENERIFANVQVQVHVEPPMRRKKRSLTVNIEVDDLSATSDAEDAWWKVEYTLPPSGHLGAHQTIQPKSKDDEACHRALFESTHSGISIGSSAISIAVPATTCSAASDEYAPAYPSKKRRLSPDHAHGKTSSDQRPRRHHFQRMIETLEPEDCNILFYTM